MKRSEFSAKLVCMGKKAYESKYSAYKHLRRLFVKQRKKGIKNRVYIYRCNVCFKYHAGHSGDE